jgi:pimeloyl-ACP methyl ester carboxylesterase
VTATVELHRWETGRGGTVLCVHETAGSSEVWRPLADALGEQARTVAYDRRGWGRSEAPEPYLRTTVHEQSEDAARLVEESGSHAAVLCGAGLGAVAALDLLLRRPHVALGAVLIEPPLLAFVEEATEVLSEDGGALRRAVYGGGPAAGAELYLSGELAAVPSWALPLTDMDANQRPARIVVSPSTPDLLRRSAEKLTARLGRAELRELPGDRPAHLDDPRGLATLILELLPG